MSLIANRPTSLIYGFRHKGRSLACNQLHSIMFKDKHHQVSWQLMLAMLLTMLQLNLLTYNFRVYIPHRLILITWSILRALVATLELVLQLQRLNLEVTSSLRSVT